MFSYALSQWFLRVFPVADPVADVMLPIPRTERPTPEVQEEGRPRSGCQGQCSWHHC